MSVFSIHDVTVDGREEIIGRIQASNGESALRKFMHNNLMLLGVYKINKSEDGIWRMTSQYGTNIYALKEV